MTQVFNFPKICLLLISLFSLSILSAQNYTTAKNAGGKAKIAFEEAQKKMSAGDKAGALKALDEAIADKDNFIDAHLMRGQILRGLSRLDEAKSAFQKALSIDANYDTRIIYGLALMEKESKNFEKAAKLFDTFASLPNADATMKEKAKALATECRGLNATTAAKPMEAKPTETQTPPKPLPPTDVVINSKDVAEKVKMTEPKLLSLNVNHAEQNQYFPSLTADGEQLFFTRAISSGFFSMNEDFFMSKKKNGEWQMAEPVTALNTKQSEGAQCISPDGQTFLFTACAREDGKGSCDLYITSYKNGKWGQPVNLSELNSERWEAMPSISGDQNTIFFASDRPGGQGNRDIWMSRKQNGKWGEPVNLGATVNTSGEDDAPFFHPDGRTLYFSSYGHNAKGQDIFVTRLNTDGTWTKPVNLGAPINTEGDEWSPYVSLDGRYTFFSRKDNGVTKIFYFELQKEEFKPQVVTYAKGIVRDKATKHPLSSKLEFRDIASNTLVQTLETDTTGTFLITLPFGKNYALTASRRNYKYESRSFNLTKDNAADKPYFLDIELTPLSRPIEGTEPKDTENAPAFTLQDLHFEFAKTEPLPESYIELDRLVDFMTENVEVKIEIQGHTDNVGSSENNRSLSQKRSEAVKKYLVEKGIVESRINCKGYGETKPIQSNDTDEGRAANRRTEFVILK
jgi:outer membrane protein OmpA-like peptidoglycan-associated protein